jgi:hypothetical protein
MDGVTALGNTCTSYFESIKYYPPKNYVLASASDSSGNPFCL